MTMKFGRLFWVCTVAALLAALVLFQILRSNGAAADDKMVVAIVNGENIYKGQITELIETLPDDQKEPLEEIYPIVLEQFITNQLLTQAVKNSDLEQDPEIRARLEQVRLETLRSAFVERHINNAVTDELVRAEYDSLRGVADGGREEVHARHIMTETAEEAREAIKTLKAGADFEELAREISIDADTAEQGGDLGYVIWEDIEGNHPAFAAALFSLETGTFTRQPIRTNLGWHVIKVEDKREFTIPEFNLVEEAIRTQLARQAVSRLVEQLRQGAEIQKFNLDGKPIETQ